MGGGPEDSSMKAESYRVGRVTMIPVGDVWHYRFRLHGKRRQKSTNEPLRCNARAELVAQEAYEAAKLRARGDEPEPTLQELVDLWVHSHILCVSPSHVSNVERFGRLHLYGMASLRLTQINTRVVEEARLQHRESHAKTSANQWLTYLKMVCRWAIRRRMIRQLPFDVPELKIKRKPKRLLPSSRAEEWLEEVKALTEHEPVIALAIRLMLDLGLRGIEARAARWEWLDLERDTYTPGDTKGGEAWPRPVPKRLMSVLRSMALPFGPMLPTHKGRVVTAGRVKRVVDLACQACDIPRITPHRLRGTYATWLAEAGVPIQDIRVVLGHKDIRTTEGYLEVDLSRVRHAQDRIAHRHDSPGRESGEQSAQMRGVIK